MLERTRKGNLRTAVVVTAALLAAALGLPAAAGTEPLAGLPDGSYVMEGGRIAVPLRADPPPWYTAEVHAAALAAAEHGHAYDFEKGIAIPLASQFLFIRPGAMMLFPSGCTMNFVYGSPGKYLLGSAGHCNKRNEDVVILAAPTLVAAIGTTKSSRDNGVGDDWSLTAVAPQFQKYVDPNVAVVGGPQCGAYTGDATLTQPVPLKHFGHGLVVGTGGTPRVGVSTEMSAKAFYFDSPSAPGDSGSPVLVAGSAACPLGQAVGILTHLIVDTRHVPSNMAGTRVTAVPATVVDGDLNPAP